MGYKKDVFYLSKKLNDEDSYLKTNSLAKTVKLLYHLSISPKKLRGYND